MPGEEGTSSITLDMLVARYREVPSDSASCGGVGRESGDDTQTAIPSCYSDSAIWTLRLVSGTAT